MSRTYISRLTKLLCLSSVALVEVGCAKPQADECIAQRFDGQSQQRFVAGQTYYLPVLDDAALCAEVRWTVSDRPSDSSDPIVKGEDGIWRITPTVTGRYVFELADADGDAVEGDGMVTLEVVAPEDRPFYHLNYYPSHAAELVDGEIWVANVYQPSITRVDPSSFAVLGEIQVGAWPVSLAWREGMEFAVVAQRGGDTLGLVELASGRLIDAIWVGDEPATVVLAPDGKTAYVALKSENAVAVVDLEARVRTARIEVGSDPLGLAISDDGATVWVSSHRSGHPDRSPFEDDALEEERDLAVIDTATNEVTDYWLDIGTTITSLLYDGERDELYVARLRNDTVANLGDPDEPNFMHEVAVFDASTGEELRSADLARQPTSGGFAVSAHGMSLRAGQLWIVAEASDLALALDPLTLEELGRVEVPGRPRSIVADPNTGAMFAHGSQATALTKITGFTATETLSTTTENRPDHVVDGQYYFTGAGRDYAQNWACNSCHADGLSDTLIWNAGPFSGRKVSRPFFWLEGTYPLGWDGYLSSVDNYAFTVNTNVGVRPTSAEHRALSAYLSSIMPPPAANGYTERDGALSELGRQGKDLFEGKAGCVSCHPLPLTTSRVVLPMGVTEGVTDIPGLIGSYRLGVWLKRGEGTSLHGAVDEVFASLGDPGLTDDERAALDRFLLELSARDFFVLTSEPRAGVQTMAIDEPMQVVFSHPAFADPANLALVSVRDEDGNEVAVTRELAPDGRHLTLTPDAALDHGRDYTIVVDPQFESFDEQRLWSPDPAAPSAWEIPLHTAEAPSLRLAGEYLWTVDMPAPDFEAQGFDLDTTNPTLTSLIAVETSAGAAVVLDYGQDLELERGFVVDAGVLHSPPLPIPIGPSFADSTGMHGELIDEDDDGIADYAEGTLTIAGPGFLESNITWRLTRPSVAGDCSEGSEGDVALTLEFDGAGLPIIDWGSGTNDGLGVYFVGPDAQAPAGPGQPVTGDDVYWAVQLAAFPTGFAGPVVYATVPDAAMDVTADVGGGDAPVPLQSGDCVKAIVTTTGFTSGSRTFVVP